MSTNIYAGCNYSIPRDQCTAETCCLAHGLPFDYLPSAAGNLALAIYFAVLILPQLGLCAYYRTWGYMVSMVVGLALEVVGYVGRLMIRYNPFNNNGFIIYLVTNTIAPVFLAAAIYLCLTRTIVLYGQHHSRIHPKWIAMGFMTSDFVSLVLQAIGAGAAASNKGASTGGTSTSQVGIDVMIAGLVFQVVSLACFLLVCADFAWRCRRRDNLDMCAEKVQIRQRWTMKAFLAGLLLATVCILIRSIFRAAELSGGFTGSLWNNQVDFMVLDGAMIGLAALCLTVLHPGVAFRGQWAAADWTFRRSGKGVDEEDAVTGQDRQ